MRIASELKAAAIAVHKFLRAIKRFPRIVQSSINPNNDFDARIVKTQLDIVRTGIRLFDFALPPAGILIGLLQVQHVPAWQIVLFWISVLIVCMTNEFVLSRKPKFHTQFIDRVSAEARALSLIILVLVTVWCLFVFSMFRWDAPISNIFTLLIMACTLSAVCTRFAPHAAAVTGPLLLMSVIMLTLEFAHGQTHHLMLFQLVTLYVALMVAQTCASHRRFYQARSLSQEREALISDLRKSKLESDDAHRQAVAASAAKSEFLANMRHEFRTPLNAIIGFSDMVQKKTFGDPGEKYSEYAGFINKSGQHLLDLIDNVLDLAKMEAGKKVLYEEPVDFAGLVRDAVRKAEDDAGLKAVAITCVLPKTLPLLLADPFGAKKILDSLLSNAVKFTPANGHIEVAAFLNDARQIELWVSDSGPGIPPEMMPTIFERFGKGRPEVTTAQRGSGLGLPIVKGLVDMHGGGVMVETAPNGGTRIIVTFPAQRTVQQASLRVA
jgi:two-component system cell cycle sensor histidine kinase PleC